MPPDRYANFLRPLEFQDRETLDKWWEEANELIEAEKKRAESAKSKEHKDAHGKGE